MAEKGIIIHESRDSNTGPWRSPLLQAAQSPLSHIKN